MQADLVRIKADFEKARLDLERSENLLKEGLISKAQFDQYKASFDVAKAQIDASQARILAVPGRIEPSRSEACVRRRPHRSTASLHRAQRGCGEQDHLHCASRCHHHESSGTRRGVGGARDSKLHRERPDDVGRSLRVITAEVKVDETDIINVRLVTGSRSRPSMPFPTRPLRNGDRSWKQCPDAFRASGGHHATRLGTSSQEAKGLQSGRDAAGTDG